MSLYFFNILIKEAIGMFGKIKVRDKSKWEINTLYICKFEIRRKIKMLMTQSHAL